MPIASQTRPRIPDDEVAGGDSERLVERGRFFGTSLEPGFEADDDLAGGALDLGVALPDEAAEDGREGGASGAFLTGPGVLRWLPLFETAEMRKCK